LTLHLIFGKWFWQQPFTPFILQTPAQMYIENMYFGRIKLLKRGIALFVATKTKILQLIRN
jgi:hypothetical protein